MAGSHQRDVASLANQRPAYATYPGAITRHVLYAIPIELQPHMAGPVNDGVRNRANAAAWANLLTPINAYIARCHEAFGTTPTKLFRIDTPQRKNSPVAPGCRLVPASESLLCEVSATTPGPRMRLRIDLHTEIFTITHIVDRAGPSSALGRALASACENGDLDAFYSDFWTGRVLDPSGAPFWKAGAEVGMVFPLRDSPGQGLAIAPYVEFRGVVLGTRSGELPPPGQEPLGPTGPSPAERTSTAKTLSDGIRSFLLTHNKVVQRAVANRSDGEADGELQSRDGNVTTEAVVCGMLDGLALYASALASRRGVVRYLVAYDGGSASQLGRFIRRLHQLGELRLAALMELNDDPVRNLRRVGQHIRRLGGEVDAALTSDHPLRAEDVAALSRSHAEASLILRSGVLYRVERSGYYVTALINRIPDLRIVRIEGWQPYDEFVRRYHSQDYEFIASIGRRYRALGQRIDRLMFLHQSQNSETYQKTLGAAVGNIEALQERAEDIAILAGIYYGAMMISHTGALAEELEAITWLQTLAPLAEALKGKEELIQTAGGVLALIMLFDMFFLERRLRAILTVGLGAGRWLLNLPILPFELLVRFLWGRARRAIRPLLQWRRRTFKRLAGNDG